MDHDCLVNQRVVPRSIRVAAGFAIVGAAFAASVNSWLLLPGLRPVPTPIWVIAFVGMFPVVGSSLVLAKVYWLREVGRTDTGPTQRRSPQQARQRSSTIANILTVLFLAWIAVVLILVFAAVSESPALSGVPDTVDGQYVLNNHGTLTPISRHDYLLAMETGQMLFAAGAMVFYLLGAFFALATRDHLIERAGRWDAAGHEASARSGRAA